MRLFRDALVVGVAAILSMHLMAKADSVLLHYGETINVSSNTLFSLLAGEIDSTGYAEGTLFAEVCLMGTATGNTNTVLIPPTPLHKLMPTTKIAGPIGTAGTPTNGTFSATGSITLRVVIDDQGTWIYNSPITNTFVSVMITEPVIDYNHACSTSQAFSIHRAVRIEKSSDLKEWHTTQDGSFGESNPIEFFRVRGCSSGIMPIIGTP